MPPVFTSMTIIDADFAENSVAAAVTALSAKLCILLSTDRVTLHPGILGTYFVTLDSNSRPAISVEV